MNRTGTLLICCLAWSGLLAIAADCRAEPLAVIFDTDMGNDVDDALALGMLHALQSRGKCQLLAVTVTKDHPQSAAFVDAVNTFYGRGEIPIGVVRKGPTPADSKFTVLADQLDNGQQRYPHDLASGADSVEATQLLRQVLSRQADQSVVIVQVGFSTNLARLLDSPADDHSPLDGVELVRKKVRLLSAMAGAFTAIGKNARFCEYNVVKDIPSARRVFHDWPGRVVMSGYEIGSEVPYPSSSILTDYNYVEHHPLAEAYKLYSPPPHNRPSWDLTSVLYAVEPDKNYFRLSRPGRIDIKDDGFSQFTLQANGTRQYLILDAAAVDRVTEVLVQLASQPGG